MVAICQGLYDWIKIHGRLSYRSFSRWYILCGDMFSFIIFIYIYEIYIYIHELTLDMYSIECIRVFKFKYIQVCIFMICANADMYVYLIFLSVEILARFHTFSPQKAGLSEGLCLFMRLVCKKKCKSATDESTSIFTYIYTFTFEYRCNYKSIYIYLYVFLDTFFPQMCLP